MTKGRKPHFSQHQARKRFGQNFLTDQSVIEHIVRAIAPATNETMVEIGPGLGALTEHLIEKIGTLAVVELDRDLIPNLKISFATRNNLHIYQADALKVNYQDLALELQCPAIRIVGNLPYNISTPLLFHLLNYKSQIIDMHFMLQKEVVDRLAAGVGDSAYGRLGIMAQYHCKIEHLLDVPPSAFNPAPKVDSAIVRLVPYTAPPIKTNAPKLLGQIVTNAFSKRRKTIRNALKNMATESQLVEAEIPLDARPEQISLAQYAKLTDLIAQTSVGDA